jgi:hypothetical protein
MDFGLSLLSAFFRVPGDFPKILLLTFMRRVIFHYIEIVKIYIFLFVFPFIFISFLILVLTFLLDFGERHCCGKFHPPQASKSHA